MQEATRKLWDLQNRHDGDRRQLFTAVTARVDAQRVLYPGSFVDVAANFVFPSVTYVDSDDRADRFFDDTVGVRELITEQQGAPTDPTVAFIHADYAGDLGLADEFFDLLVSLYAGFISETCTRYLRIGGTLLVNASHGDAAMASIDDRYELIGVVTSRSGDYHVTTRNLDSYLVAKKPIDITPGLLHERGKSIAYTKSPFAYLFTRVA